MLFWNLDKNYKTYIGFFLQNENTPSCRFCYGKGNFLILRTYFIKKYSVNSFSAPSWREDFSVVMCPTCFRAAMKEVK